MQTHNSHLSFEFRLENHYNSNPARYFVSANSDLLFRNEQCSVVDIFWRANSFLTGKVARVSWGNTAWVKSLRMLWFRSNMRLFFTCKTIPSKQLRDIFDCIFSQTNIWELFFRVLQGSVWIGWVEYPKIFGFCRLEVHKSLNYIICCHWEPKMWFDVRTTFLWKSFKTSYPPVSLGPLRLLHHPRGRSKCKISLSWRMAKNRQRETQHYVSSVNWWRAISCLIPVWWNSGTTRDDVQSRWQGVIKYFIFWDCFSARINPKIVRT